MKKLTLIVVLVLTGLSPLFCEKYTEVAEIMESFIVHTNEYADAVLAAETGDQIAEIFLKYSRLIQQDQIALMSIPAVYPELAAMDEPPAELLPLASQMGALQEKMGQINAKLMQFMNEPAMMDAAATITKEMEELMEIEQP